MFDLILAIGTLASIILAGILAAVLVFPDRDADPEKEKKK